MIHSCVEAHIEDVSHTTVSIQQPCCCNPVKMHSVNYDASIYGYDIEGIYILNDAFGNADIDAEAVNKADIAMEWVCGVGYSVNYLRVTPTETVWISIDYSVDYNVYSNTDWLLS